MVFVKRFKITPYSYVHSESCFFRSNFQKIYKAGISRVIIDLNRIGVIFLEIWGQILIAVVPAIVSGIVAYYKATSNAKVEIHKVEKNAETELARIEKEYEGKVKELQEERKADLAYYQGKLEADNKQAEQNYINELTAKFMGDLFDGSIDGDQIKNMEDIVKKMDGKN